MDVVLTKFIWGPNYTTNGFWPSNLATRLCLEVPGKPKDTTLDFLDLTADTGESLEIVGHYEKDFT